MSEDWTDIKDMCIHKCDKVLGKVEKNRKEWLTDDTPGGGGGGTPDFKLRG